MNYKRVIPRDFFNEAKLLKCLGRLELFVMESSILNSVLEDSESGFKVCKNEFDGSIYCSNYYVFDNSGTNLYLCSGLNSRLNYPLYFSFLSKENGELSGYVFDEKGGLAEAFKELLELSK